MIPQDYHVHTLHSCDSKATMAEMCRAAVEKGIPEIAFTDHFDLVPEDPCCDFFRADAWWKDFDHCRREFSGILQLRAGVEIGEPHRFPKEVEDLTAAYDWDFVMGSLHWVADDPVFKPEYFQRPKHDAYADYFRELHMLAQQNSVNILGHLDLVKRYGYELHGPYDPDAHEEILRTLLRTCAQHDIALEVNTSTLRRSTETSPTRKILSWFLEEGGRWVTLGSDAHKPDEVGFGMERGMQEVAGAGFRTLARFERFRVGPISLPTG